MRTKNSSGSIALDLRVDKSGDVEIPDEVLKRLKIRPGTRIHVRLTSGVLSKRLEQRRVTEEEIETISAVQLEPRGNVVQFLMSEGELARRNSFKTRAKRLFR